MNKIFSSIMIMFLGYIMFFVFTAWNMWENIHYSEDFWKQFSYIFEKTCEVTNYVFRIIFSIIGIIGFLIGMYLLITTVI